MNTQWTWLITMAADNSLESSFQADLDEIKKADIGKVQVRVALDRPNQNTFRKTLKGDHTFDDLDLGKNENFGDWKVLAEFLKDGQKDLPASRIAPILWSHGNGFKDFQLAGMIDITGQKPAGNGKGPANATLLDGTSHDFLSNSEMATALNDAKNGKKFDLIGCDACLMAMLEVAHEIRDCGEIYVASQDNTQTDGWPYDKILGEFGNDLPAEAAGEVIFMKSREGPPGDKTISVIRLGKIGDVATALNKLGAALVPLLPTQLTAIRTARSKVKRFPPAWCIDLRHFAMLLQSELSASMGAEPASNVVSAADAVIAAVDAAVVRPTPVEANDHAFGISVYVPVLPITDHDFDNTSLSAAAKDWAKFVHSFAGPPAALH